MIVSPTTPKLRQMIQTDTSVLQCVLTLTSRSEVQFLKTCRFESLSQEAKYSNMSLHIAGLRKTTPTLKTAQVIPGATPCRSVSCFVIKNRNGSVHHYSAQSRTFPLLGIRQHVLKKVAPEDEPSTPNQFSGAGSSLHTRMLCLAFSKMSFRIFG